MGLWFVWRKCEGMSRIPDDIVELVRLLKEYGVEFAICGGHAVAFHGYPRLTVDVDVLVLPSPENAARVLAALDEFGFGDCCIPREALEREGSAVTLGVQPNQVDLLTSMSTQPTREVVRNAVDGELGGTSVRYVSLGDLLRAKGESDRPKDQADLDELIRMRKDE